MKKTITINEFRDEFHMIRPDNFSYEALGILFRNFEDYEAQVGEELELDVIAVCCDFAEATAEELIKRYSIDVLDCHSVEEIRKKVKECLENESVYIGQTKNTFVYQTSF